MGMDVLLMHRHHVSDAHLYAMSGWETVKELVQKANMFWLGHVERMSIERRPKQVLFAWWEARKPRQSYMLTRPMYFSKTLRARGISEMDWFRLAQNRKEWCKLVVKN